MGQQREPPLMSIRDRLFWEEQARKAGLAEKVGLTERLPSVQDRSCSELLFEMIASQCGDGAYQEFQILWFDNDPTRLAGCLNWLRERGLRIDRRRP